MIYTETEKKELDEVRRVFAEHLRQCPDYELLWSDKVGYVWLAIGIKAAILLLAAIGLGTLWLAVFADVGVTVLAVLNAMRALRVQE